MKMAEICQNCRRVRRWKYGSTFISRYMGIIWMSSREPVTFDAEEPDFLEWLKARYDTYPAKLYLLCQAVGYYGDYNKCMEWYRRRYRKEIMQGRILHLENPFNNKNQED